jgi:hypothetical protein
LSSLLPFMSDYLPHYPIVKHPHPVFFACHEKQISTPIQNNRQSYNYFCILQMA